MRRGPISGNRRNSQLTPYHGTGVDELLDLRIDEETTCNQVRQQVEDKLVEVESKLRMLQEMQHALTAMAASCDQRGECPVLTTLADQESQTGRLAATVKP